MKIDELLIWLNSQSNQAYLKSISTFGINTEKSLGVSIPVLRDMAKTINKNNVLAQELWDSDIHEARILASMIACPLTIKEETIEEWVNDFDSWGLCDQVCSNLIAKTNFAMKKIDQWTNTDKEFTKRAGFVLIAVLSVHKKDLSKNDFEYFFSIIINKANDERNFIKKAISWALRQIGKRNSLLNLRAIEIAEELKTSNNKTKKWIGNQAYNELKTIQIKRFQQDKQ